MESLKQEFLVKNLPTRSVTLYPSRAHVVRDIHDVSLKPGQNEIEIYGLTPTIDEQSVQIDGKGDAVITDIAVELVPNREIFEELYPDEDNEQDDEDEDEEIELEECEEVKRLAAEIEELEAQSASCTETINSASRQLETLDAYSKSIRADKNKPEDVIKTIEMYEDQRNDIFVRHCDARQKLKDVEKSIAEKTKQKTKAGIADRKRHDERVRAKTKERQRKANQQRERQRQTDRIREERLKFFPKKVYKVTVNLETALNNETPALSRRGSADSLTLAPSVMSEDNHKAGVSTGSDCTSVSLSLSYVTRDASWTPRYDISVSSLQKSASIAYRAELVNGTSETWKEAQLYLSTSQTSYGGLADKVPTIQPWHVKLNQYHDQGLLSPQEMSHSRTPQAHTQIIFPSRNELFGSSDNVFTWGSTKHQVFQQQQQQQKVFSQAMQQRARFAHAPPAPPPPAAAFGVASSLGASSQNLDIRNAPNVFGSTTGGSRAGGLFGSFGNATTAAAPAAPLRRSRSHVPAPGGVRAEAEVSEEDENQEDEVRQMGQPVVSQLGYQEASWEDDGLTSTYEIPGARTLVPSSLARRHKLASLTVSNVQLSHIAVPKLLASTFLRAKIRNPSSTVTLLKGTAGVTLDGSFLGNINISRVSPGRIIDLPLGIDPAVSINYPIPTVRRSTQGLFNKETSQVFTRNIWITNSKGTAVEISILDQVPVSDDERLTIGVIEPRGLNKAGDVVKAGTAATEGVSGPTTVAKRDTWGKAKAALEENGKVTWTVSLEKKQACLLKLEYETKMPSTEKIMSA